MTIIVNQIGDSAFKNCVKLKNISIPSKFTSIGSSAFQNCNSIKNAIIPNSISIVGNNAFNGCSNLTYTTISNKITFIENNSYINCFSLKNISFPSSVLIIGESAFENSGLTSIIFPSNITTIGKNAFKKNYSLRLINVKNYLAYIDEGCFYDATSLYSITIPGGVTINGNTAFYNIPHNEKPTPTNAATLYTTDEGDDIVFQYFFSIYQTTINYSIGILVYTLNNVNYYIGSINSTTAFVGLSPEAKGYVIIEKYIPYNGKKYEVTRIGFNAFQNSTLITSIKIPNSVSTIDGYAFENCISLSSIVLPDSLLQIQIKTFKGCTSLMSITIPGNITSINDYAFQDCISLNNITLPYSLLNIGISVFKNCVKLPYISIPYLVSKINEDTFRNCTSLLSVIIPNNVTEIGNFAFKNCTSLFTIVIPSTVTQLGDQSFSNIPNNNDKSSLTAATLYTPDLDPSYPIYSYFFLLYGNNIYYRNVMPIYSIQNVSYYKNNNFNDKSYVGDSPNANGGILLKNSFINNAGNTFIVTTINESAFQDCNSLNSMEIPLGIISIGDSAFQSCSDLSSITIANTVVTIGNYAFYDCTSLYFMYIPSSVILIGTNNENAFSGIPYNKTDQPTTPKNASTLYTSPCNASNYVYTYFYKWYTNKINYIIYPKPIICFKEDTKILTKNGYRPIQSLRPGDLIKTIKHGYKGINMIGYRELYNTICDERIKDKLYKCTYKNFPEIFEDLVITGCHSILVDNFKDDEQLEKTKKILGGIYSTDDKWRLPACVDERCLHYEKEGNFTIYHLALDNDDYYMNYGIYANGLVVETCSKRFLKELANYQLLE